MSPTDNLPPCEDIVELARSLNARQVDALLGTRSYGAPHWRTKEFLYTRGLTSDPRANAWTPLGRAVANHIAKLAQKGGG
jgi:hypothetical protein